MRLPITGWKHTLKALGYRIVWKKSNRKRKAAKTESLSYGSLEPRKLLALSPELSVIDSQWVDEGQTFSISATYSDADLDDTHTASIDWGDGTIQAATAENGTITASYKFQDNGFFQPKLTLTDSQTLSDETTFDVTVNNVAPVVSYIESYENHTIYEGDRLYFISHFSDPSDSDTFSVIFYPDGTDGEGIEFSHHADYHYDNVNVAEGLFVPPEDGQYDSILRISDDDGGFVDHPVSFEVLNRDPTIEASVVSTEVDEGSVYTLDFSAIDPGDDTITKWTVDWGDGESEDFLASASSAEHVYKDDGQYSITLTATDEDGTYVKELSLLHDSSFGDGGVVATDFANATYDSVYTTLEQPDGKVLVAGRGYQSDAGGYNFAITRYHADGSLDTDFGVDGTTFTDFGGYDLGRSLAIQALQDGGFRILLAGSGNNQMSVAAYTSDGLLDATFAGNGKRVVDLPGVTHGQVESLLVQPDGKIVLAGRSYVFNTTRDDLTLTRLNFDGSLDSSFNSVGFVRTGFGTNSHDHGYSVAYHSGKLIVAGSASLGGSDFAIVRFNSDGSLDNSFSGDGRVKLDIAGGTDVARQVIVQDDGRIVVGGHAYNGAARYDFALLRVNEDGSLDESFGANGKTLTGFATGAYDTVTSMTLDPQGRILLGGQSLGQTVLARYSADGILDSSFGEEGRLQLDVRGGVTSLLTTQDGNLLITRGGSTPALTKIHSDNVVTVNNVAPVVSYITSYENRTIYEGDRLDFFSHFSDPSDSDTFSVIFYPDGTDGEGIEFSHYAHYHYDNVNVVEGQFVPPEDGQYDSILRISDDDGGFVDHPVSFEVLNRDPTIEASVVSTEVDEGSVYTLDFSATDPGDDTITKWTVDWGDGESEDFLASASSAEHVYKDDGQYSITLTATDEDGTYVKELSLLHDSSFGDGGVVATDFANATNDFVYTTVQQPDGKVLVGGGAYQADAGGYNFAITRYHADGSLDTDFGVDGTTFTDFGGYDLGRSLAIQTLDNGDFRILLIGGSSNKTSIAAYTSDGALDPAFAGGEETIAIEDLNSGIAADDTATGTGFILYSSESVHIRFSGVLASNADHFISVRFNSGQWQYHNNTAWRNFTPDFNDRLVADVDFSLDTVATLEGTDTLIEGIRAGYASGDLAFVANRWNGISNAGEFGISGTSFVINRLGGKQVVDLPGVTGENVESVLVQPDGKIVLAGRSYQRNTSRYDFTLTRLNSDGGLDSSFGAGGFVRTNFGTNSNDHGYSVAYHDGQLIVAGQSSADGLDFAVARYNADGTLDTSFSSDGIVKTDFAGSSDFARSVLVQDDGKVVVGGYANNGAERNDFALLRYNVDGTLDTSFGADGTGQVLTGLEPGNNDTATRMAFDQQGRILLAGSTRAGSTSQQAVVRYDADGSIDTSFGNDGKLLLTTGGSSVTDLLVTSDGNLLITRYVHSLGTGNVSTLTKIHTDNKVTVNNVAPVMSFAGAYNYYAGTVLHEGGTVHLFAQFLDPSDSDTYTAFVYPEGVGGESIELPVQTSRQGDQTRIRVNYARFDDDSIITDDGLHEPVIRLIDDDGGVVEHTFAIDVLDVAATITVSADQTTVNEGDLFEITFSSIDPGDDPVVKWEVNWGDGNGWTEYPATTSSATHIYQNAGNYTVEVRATNDDNIVAEAPSVHVAVAPFFEQIGDYAFRQTGGSIEDRATAIVQDEAVKLAEGDSFKAELSREVIINRQTNRLFFSFTDLVFDGAGSSSQNTQFVNDAFEIALLGADGTSVVPTIGQGHDAFFNITEHDQGNPRLADGVTYGSDIVAVDLSAFAANIGAGSNASVTVVFRMLNNDTDNASMVKIQPTNSTFALWGTDEDSGDLFRFTAFQNGTTQESTGYHNFGKVHYDPGDGSRSPIPDSQTQIESFTITSANTAYFVANQDIVYNGQTLPSPVLFTINLNEVEQGDHPTDDSLDTWKATVVGNINIASGTITSLVLNPADGNLIALHEVRGGVDRLFDIDISGFSTSVLPTEIESANSREIRTAAGAAVPLSSQRGEALAFGPKGQLFLADDSGDNLYLVDPESGVILDLVDSNLGAGIEGRGNNGSVKVEGLAYNPFGGNLIASATGQADADFLFEINFDEQGNVIPTTVNITRDLGRVDRGIDLQDSATGTGWILHSVETRKQRFSNANFRKRHSRNLVAVRFENGQWQYSDSSTWRNFTPRSTDTLIAAVNYSTDTITSLQGQNGIEHGVRAGYVSGDLTFQADRFNGRFDNGEFTVNGTQFVVEGSASETIALKTKLFETPSEFGLTDIEGMAFVTVGLPGTGFEDIEPGQPASDINRLVDVTERFTVQYQHTSFNSTTDVLFARHSLDHSTDTVQFPGELQDELLVVVTNISDPSVTLNVPDGNLPDNFQISALRGAPYVNLSEVISQSDGFFVREMTDGLILRFNAPNGNQFTYDVVILSAFEAIPGITLVEDADLITTNESETDGETASFIVPENPGRLRIDFNDLVFDGNSGNPLDSNDSFEIAVVRKSDHFSILPTIAYQLPFGPLVNLPWAPLSNAQFNYSQGQTPLTADGVVFNELGGGAGEVLIDISTLTPGTELEIIARLLNNDADDTSSVSVNFNLDAADQGRGTSLTNVVGNRLPNSPQDNEITFIDSHILDNVSADFDLAYTHTTYDNRLNRLHVGLNLTKAGGLGIRDDLVLAVLGLTDQAKDGLTDAKLASFDGVLSTAVDGAEAGTPYIRLSSLLEKDNRGFYVAGAALQNIRANAH